jgi:hypothetical protein
MMPKLTAKDLALTICFIALYVIFGFIKISPIIGLPGQAITAAAIMAPLMGIILGPYISTLSTFMGGLVGFFFGSFSLLSFASGIFAALCSGLTYNKKRVGSIVAYFFLFLLFAFYPIVGPIWLFPATIWFQIIVFFILLSPLQSAALRNFNSEKDGKLLFAFFITALTSTLAGQIAGSLTLELIQMPDVNYFRGTWEAITFLYPVERIIIALSAAFIGVPLTKVLKSTNATSNFMQKHLE